MSKITQIKIPINERFRRIHLTMPYQIWFDFKMNCVYSNRRISEVLIGLIKSYNKRRASRILKKQEGGEL